MQLSWLAWVAGTAVVVAARPQDASPATSQPASSPMGEPSAELIALHDELKEKGEQSRENKKQSTLTIPTYFHVCAESEDGLQRASNETIARQVQTLNDAFKEAKINFDLKDTTRDVNPSWARDKDEDKMLTQYRKGDASTLHIFVVDFVSSSNGDPLPGKAGYPRKAMWEQKEGEKTDAVIVPLDNLPGNKWQTQTMRGTNVVQEVAHWFGILNTYFVGAGEQNCTDAGDRVQDTPAHTSQSKKGKTSKCDGENQCTMGQKDLLDNFMSAGDDECRNKFTPGQLDRVRDLFSQTREKPESKNPKQP